MQFDLSRLYSLLQAFDLTGRRIFGQTWRGNEAFARPTDNPQPLREERERLLTRIVMLEREEQEHSAIFKVDAGREAFNAASRALAPIKEKKPI